MADKQPYKNEFEGKVAFVTGAAGGIGFAAAREFASQGASVVLAGHNPATIEAAAASLIADGHTALGVECDVTDEESSPLP